MEIVSIPLCICNSEIPKECLQIYAWCVYLTKINKEDWLQLDYLYLKQHTGYSFKKLSSHINFLTRLKLIEFKKSGSKQFVRGLISDIPESFIANFQNKESEFLNLKQTQANIRNFNYVDPETILNNA